MRVRGRRMEATRAQDGGDVGERGGAVVGWLVPERESAAQVCDVPGDETLAGARRAVEEDDAVVSLGVVPLDALVDLGGLARGCVGGEGVGEELRDLGGHRADVEVDLGAEGLPEHASEERLGLVLRASAVPGSVDFGVCAARMHLDPVEAERAVGGPEDVLDVVVGLAALLEHPGPEEDVEGEVSGGAVQVQGREFRGDLGGDVVWVLDEGIRGAEEDGALADPGRGAGEVDGEVSDLGPDFRGLADGPVLPPRLLLRHRMDSTGTRLRETSAGAELGDFEFSEE